MKNIKVSIIIPVYNIEEYLEKCLDSAVNQTLKDIEIICVNDGSTDNSRSILEEYAKNDSHIVIIDKENAGLGAARNTGMDHANGDYILFLDSDDWLDLEAAESLYNQAILEDFDLVFFKIKPYDEEKDEFFKRDDYDLIAVKDFFNKSNINYKSLKNSIFRFSVVAYNRIYKRSFLDKFSMKFPEGLIFEDNPFFYEVILKADNIKFLDEYYLYRRFRDNSIMTSCDSRFLDIIPITDLTLDAFRNNGLFDEYLEPLVNFKISKISIFYRHILDEYKDIYFAAIKEDFKKINQNDLYRRQFTENLNKRNLYFYLNALNSESVHEFDTLNEISNLKINNDNLKSSLKSYKKTNKQLKKKIKIIESSNSWKMTKPLRSIVGLLKKR